MASSDPVEVQLRCARCGRFDVLSEPPRTGAKMELRWRAKRRGWRREWHGRTRWKCPDCTGLGDSSK